MAVALTLEDRERLKQALAVTNKATQQYLAPLLGLEPVHVLLLSFLNDPTKSLEDWIWHPQTQRVLDLYRANPNAVKENQSELAMHFEQQFQVDTMDQMVQELEDKHQDGRNKFKNGDFYPAMNAFKASLSVLAKIQDVNSPLQYAAEGQTRFVTLCCNVAVCGLKLGDYSKAREFANKALQVDPKASKALYAFAKANMLLFDFEQARAVIAQALEWYPDNQAMVKLSAECDKAEQERTAHLVEMAQASEQKQEEERIKEEEQAKRNAERLLEEQNRVDHVSLPAPMDEDTIVSRLTVFFNRIRHQLWFEYEQRNDPDNGEPSLFACKVTDRTNEVVLADNIEAPSKRVAKIKAAMAATLKLWQDRRDADKLLPEDNEKWAAFEAAATNGPDETPKMIPTMMTARPAILSSRERLNSPISLLSQLHQQQQLHVVFDMIDVTEDKTTPRFQCMCSINGQQAGKSDSVSAKKKAKQDAAKQALQFAVDSKLVRFRDLRLEDREDDEDENDNDANNDA